jgi:cytidylate kinase
MPLITMPREMGTLGKDVAARVALRLGKPVVHHEVIDPLANKLRLRKSHVIRFLDGRAGLLERMNTDETSLSIFTADEILRLAAAGGTGVIRGWGATHLLTAVPHVLRVRVCAPLELRVERMMARLDTPDRARVVREIEASDEAASAITRRHFNIDWRDAVHYDLVLNTERLAVDECAEEILALAARPRFAENDASREALAGLALAARVRATLRGHDSTRRLDIVIASAGGNVTLSGIVGTQDEASAAASVAASVQGVTGVTNQLQHTQRGFRRMGG